MDRTTHARPARRAMRLAGDSGMSLVEILATVSLLVVAITMIALAGGNGLRIQAASERTAIASNAQADILAKARAVHFAELGFYDNQPGVARGQVTLPLRDDSGAQLREPAVSLGPTKPASVPFDVAPVERFNDDEDNPLVAYRASTYITSATGTPAAVRVTVLVEWTPLANQAKLDGTCTDKNVHCSIQTIVRAATGADQTPGGDTAWSSATCNATSGGASAVCETYVRSGRVLDGSSMVSSTDLPAQDQPVDIYARTTGRAQEVTASWTQVVLTPAGLTTTVGRTIELEAVDNGTRWAATVPADERDATPRGIIRPGKATVTITARMDDGSVRTATTQAFWSVALDTHGALSIDPASISQTCDPAGGTFTFTVTGHSAGLRTTNTPAAADDRLDVAFTQAAGPVIQSITTPATLVSVTPVIEVIAGTPIEVATTATWQVTAPPTANCGITRHAVAQVHRAIDHTVTNIPLTMEAS